MDRIGSCPTQQHVSSSELTENNMLRTTGVENNINAEDITDVSVADPHVIESDSPNKYLTESSSGILQQASETCQLRSDPQTHTQLKRGRPKKSKFGRIKRNSSTFKLSKCSSHKSGQQNELGDPPPELADPFTELTYPPTELLGDPPTELSDPPSKMTDPFTGLGDPPTVMSDASRSTGLCGLPKEVSDLPSELSVHCQPVSGPASHTISKRTRHKSDNIHKKARRDPSNSDTPSELFDACQPISDPSAIFSEALIPPTTLSGQGVDMPINTKSKRGRHTSNKRKNRAQSSSVGSIPPEAAVPSSDLHISGPSRSSLPMHDLPTTKKSKHGRKKYDKKHNKSECSPLKSHQPTELFRPQSDLLDETSQPYLMKSHQPTELFRPQSDLLDETSQPYLMKSHQPIELNVIEAPNDPHEFNETEILPQLAEVSKDMKLKGKTMLTTMYCI